MARNHKFYFDRDGVPHARGPASEQLLMNFLEVDVQGSDHVCHDLMDDLTAIEDGSDELREFTGNAHVVTITRDGVSLSRGSTPTGTSEAPDGEAAPAAGGEEAVEGGIETDGAAAAPGSAETGDSCKVALKHFREVLEDWEAFILEDQLDDPSIDDDLPS